jgi:ribonuclease VapC
MASPVVVDSSAIIAILRGESESPDFQAVLNASAGNFCSTVTFVESYMVATSRNAGSPPELHAELLDDLGIATVPLDQAQAMAASTAFLRFGKGRHPARLNMGDCFSYALAKSLNAPLLFKGDDFSRTDIASALVTGARP